MRTRGAEGDLASASATVASPTEPVPAAPKSKRSRDLGTGAHKLRGSLLLTSQCERPLTRGARDQSKRPPDSGMATKPVVYECLPEAAAAPHEQQRALGRPDSEEGWFGRQVQADWDTSSTKTPLAPASSGSEALEALVVPMVAARGTACVGR
jgi:hypothetical protein